MLVRDQGKQKKRRHQERLVVVIAVAIVGASVGTTLWFSGAVSGSKGADYRNTTFTDAVLQCDAELRQQYQKQLRLLTLDDHSSRFDQAAFQYKIFFKAQMTNGKGGAGTSQFYFSCFVNPERGNIAKVEVAEQKESQTEAIRQQDGGLFGWP